MAASLPAFILALALAGSAASVAAAQDRDAACALLSRTGDHYARQPLPGFDTASSPAPLTVPNPEGATAVVLCRRGVIVPEMSDYRVLAEAHVPLALTDERRILFLELVDGKIRATLRRGQFMPGEQAAVDARVGELQAQMSGEGPAK
jgi:hypothetical protein